MGRWGRGRAGGAVGERDDGGVRGGGGELYCPADPLAPGERWVCVPGMADVYALPAEARAAHHGACCRVWNAWGAAPALPRAVEALAWPVVWLLVASHPDAVPVRRVERGGVDRGGVCSGLTRPILMPARGSRRCICR
ncbi:MAG: hypothetical protein R3F65_03760 [bacterium]